MNAKREIHVKKAKQVKPGNVRSLLDAADAVDGGFTDRTEPHISRKEAEELMAMACRRFLGLEGKCP